MTSVSPGRSAIRSSRTLCLLLSFCTLLIIAHCDGQELPQTLPAFPSLTYQDVRSLLYQGSDGPNFIIRFDPPKHYRDEEAAFLHQFMQAGAVDIKSSMMYTLYTNPKAATTFYVVDCAKDPACCIGALGILPAARSTFARRNVYGNPTTLETYDGPSSLDALQKFFLGQPQPKYDDETLTVAKTRAEDTCPEPVPKRPDGQGVYIYDGKDFPWARVLDDDCGVSTTPSHRIDDSEIPILDSSASPNELRDPGYFAVLRPFLKHTIDAGLVVDDPEKARWFLIPFDLDRSYQLGDDCSNSTHLERVHTVLRGLQESPYYKRRGGSDHVLVVMHYAANTFRRRNLPYQKEMEPQLLAKKYFPPEQWHVIANMTLIRYIGGGARPKLLHYYADRDDTRIAGPRGFVPQRGPYEFIWWGEGEDWRCTITAPVLTPSSIEQVALTANQTFDAWLQRPYLLHYRGNGEKIPIGKSQILHDTMLAMKSLFPDGIISKEHAKREDYASELAQSKFCLVIRGDDPHRSRFNDAVAAGCIPVIIADGWELSVAPFQDWINYRSFSITIPESMFLGHATSALYYAYGQPKAKLQKLYARLLENRPYICWGLSEGPTKSVGYLVWKAINNYCDVDRETS